MTDELINKFYKIFDDGIVRQIKKLDVDCKKAERIRCSVTNNRRRGTELWLRNEDCVVVGNIYQNSELLERIEG
ncbi:phage protein [Streptococcus agalactiae]|uniref:YopX family protein n=1 Tax=Streptococcus agalactiae TaxID=1311 RepID=UPI000DFB3B35|nr:YopX family protein [Streptococcus agalactiae]SUN02006.1 phage protein [Streptococcus agalactiae]SUN03041.1 phage protein [Streptococcus agalactiae]